MGSCYSRLGSKSAEQYSSKSPIDRCQQLSDHQLVDDKTLAKNYTSSADKPKSVKLSYNKHEDLSSSFEHLSYSEVKDKQNKGSMSSLTNRRKVQIHPTRPVAQNKAKQDTTSKGQNVAKVAALESSKTVMYDNSSSTSISSESSINLSKCSYKTSTSSSLNSLRANSSIPKPKSRTPTPPITILDATSKTHNSLQFADKSKITENSIIYDRLNGNRLQTNTKIVSKENQMINQKNSDIKGVVSHAVINSGIKYKTQVSGLPRPQTAQIVTTSQSDAIAIKFNDSSDKESRKSSTQYSQKFACDPNLRQLNKPLSYYYGMNKQCPYMRPNTNFNINKSQIQTNAPLINNQSRQMPEKPANHNSLAFNPTIKAKSVSNYQTNNETMKYLNDDNNSLSFREISLNKASYRSEISDEKVFNLNDIPNSILRIKEIEILNNQKDSRIENKDSVIKKSINKEKKSTEKMSPEHHSISSASGNETDNRDFLIDDEICDQPELVLSASIEKKDMLKNVHLELEGLISKQESVSSSTPSSPVSIITSSPAANASTASTTFRRPRPLSFVELPNGSYGLDSPSFRAACSDLIGIKTLLFRLQGILQNAETLNPFDHTLSQNKFYQQLLAAESDDNHIKKNDFESLSQENFDLKRQIVLMQHQMEDKDRTIQLLQQQMAKYSTINNAFVSQNVKREMINGTTQTECCANASGINPRAVSDGSNGMLISLCCTHQI